MAGNKNSEKITGNKKTGNKNSVNKEILNQLELIFFEIFRNLQQNTINRLLLRSGRPNGGPPNGPPNGSTTTTNNNNTNKKKIIEEIANNILIEFLTTYDFNLTNEEKQNLLTIIKNLINAKINELKASTG